jgi:hypothetical protein
MTEQATIEFKKAFAAALLKQPDENPFKAALSITSDASTALQASREWVYDPIVVEEKLRLISEFGQKGFLPTKEEQAKAIYLIANYDLVDAETRLKAHRLYAELMSYIEKPNAGGGINVLNQGVMIVRDQGSDSEWEERALRQQRNLVLDGNAAN